MQKAPTAIELCYHLFNCGTLEQNRDAKQRRSKRFGSRRQLSTRHDTTLETSCLGVVATKAHPPQDLQPQQQMVLFPPVSALEAGSLGKSTICCCGLVGPQRPPVRN